MQVNFTTKGLYYETTLLRDDWSAALPDAVSYGNSCGA